MKSYLIACILIVGPVAHSNPSFNYMNELRQNGEYSFAFTQECVDVLKFDSSIGEITLTKAQNTGAAKCTLIDKQSVYKCKPNVNECYNSNANKIVVCKGGYYLDGNDWLHVFDKWSMRKTYPPCVPAN